MFIKIKNKIDSQLRSYIHNIDRLYSLSKISPLLFANIKEFVSRKGKRIRPIFFILGYLGYAKKIKPGLYRSAVSIELLHDFMLVHDDIIDKSRTRRGNPSMHTMFNRYLSGNKDLKFTGEDLTIVAGDVMYAMALDAFLSIKEEPKRKEDALRKLITAALYTGSGEFIELLSGIKNIGKVKKEDIYQVYDLKTANYTFASPLAIGATLAGAKKAEIKKLFKYGICLGRAFQIKDDIIGVFGKESVIGKPNITDIKEAKKTLLIWMAYKKANKKDKSIIEKTLKNPNVNYQDFLKIRQIILKTKALDDANKEITDLLLKAKGLLKTCRMHPHYKNPLDRYTEELLCFTPHLVKPRSLERG